MHILSTETDSRTAHPAEPPRPASGVCGVLISFASLFPLLSREAVHSDCGISLLSSHTVDSRDLDLAYTE